MIWAAGVTAAPLAAVLAYGDRAVLSHVSAAAHWNLLQYDAPQPEITAPASRRGTPGIRLHRSRSLDAQDTTRHEGIPITTVARTLLDIAVDTAGNAYVAAAKRRVFGRVGIDLERSVLRLKNVS